MPRPTGSPRWPRRSRPPIDVLTHPALAQLHPTFGHPDSPERLEVLLEAFPDAREGRAAERSAAERVHAPEYLNRLATLTEPGLWDADTVVSETSWTAALLAAGIAIEAAETGAFALVRPPGHHARPRTAMGFCLVNNVAVAARHMQAEHGVGRVAIVDYDVHHGNGTQEIFWEDDSVLFVSTASVAVLPRHRRADRAGRDDRERSVERRLRGRRVPPGVRPASRAGGRAVRPRAAPGLGRLRRS